MGVKMGTSPYRTAPQKGSLDRAAPAHDTDLLLFFALLWIASAVRVAVGLWYGETFTTELTLATAAVCLLPWLTRDALAALLRRKTTG